MSDRTTDSNDAILASGAVDVQSAQNGPGPPSDAHASVAVQPRAQENEIVRRLSQTYSS
jgi:hypothetical protein